MIIKFDNISSGIRPRSQVLSATRSWGGGGNTDVEMRSNLLHIGALFSDGYYKFRV